MNKLLPVSQYQLPLVFLCLQVFKPENPLFLVPSGFLSFLCPGSLLHGSSQAMVMGHRKPCPPPVAGEPLNTCSYEGSSVPVIPGDFSLHSKSHMHILRHMPFSLGFNTFSISKIQE